MDLSNILQESILNISTQVFLNRLVLFNLISLNEYGILQNSKKNNITTTTTFIIQKLNNKTAIYHEKFKIFLGYYKDLNFLYHTWDTLG